MSAQTKYRYLNSFFITSVLYLIASFFLFYVFADTIIEEEKKPEEIKISLKHMMAVQEPVPVQPIVEQTPIEPIIEKRIDKPKKEKRPDHKKPEHKKFEHKKFEHKEPLNETSNEHKNEIVHKNLQRNESEPKTEINEKKEYLDKNLAQIRDLINKNIKYPIKAKKLMIEDIVVVKFKILENGLIENIEIIEGNPIFNTSIIESIKEASKNFPKNNISIEIQIPIEYKII